MSSESNCSLTDRWCLHIDILGFSNKFMKEERAKINGESEPVSMSGRPVMKELGVLLDEIYHLGMRFFDDEHSRLFVYQVGDAFIIIGDNFEENLLQGARMAVRLMRHCCLKGILTRGAVALGSSASWDGWYKPKPESLIENSERGNYIKLGQHGGFINYNPVIGSAMINAADLDKKEPRGPLLIVDSRINLPNNEFYQETVTHDYYTVNWISSKVSLFFEPGSKDYNRENPDFGQAIKNYLKHPDHHEQKKRWHKNILKFLNIEIL